MDEDLLKQEIETQNYASELYEELRYKNPYSRMWHDWHVRKMIGMADRKKIQEGIILDNGCGIGILSEHLPASNIIGIDVSPGMAKLAGKKMKKVLTASSEDLPFGNESFDAVFSRSLLHHLHNPEKAIGEVFRVLKKDGEAVFSETLSSFVNFLPRKILYKGRHFSSLHKNFSRRELISLLKNHFNIEKIVYFGFLAYPLLAFPDVVNFLKWLPFKKATVPALISIDKFLMKTPLINRQAWGTMIKAKKEK